MVKKKLINKYKSYFKIGYRVDFVNEIKSKTYPAQGPNGCQWIAFLQIFDYLEKETSAIDFRR